MADKQNPFAALASMYYQCFKEFLKQTGGNVALSRELAMDVLRVSINANKASSNPTLDALAKMWTEDDKEEPK